MKIKELLNDKTKWCQQHAAVDHNDNPTCPRGPDAVRWCLIGALLKCDPAEDSAVLEKLQSTIQQITGKYGGVIGYNDAPTTRFEDIQHLLQLADV